MDKAFLENLGIGEEAQTAILQAHSQALQQLQLDAALQQAVAQAGGRNVKAVTAMLDLDALRQAEDPKAAAQAAIEQLKKENEWLFAAPAVPYAPHTGAAQRFTNPEPQTLAEALRQRFRK